MLTINLAFAPDLAPLLGPAAARRPAVVRRVLPGATSVKDAVEALGIPHCEIGTVTAADGSPRRLDDPVTDGDHLTIAGVARADPGRARFLCDRHLAALARLLRTLGFDTAWDPAWGPAELARRGLHEDRILLSGSRALLKRRLLGAAMLIRDDEPDAQVASVVRRYGLAGRVQPFARCPLCNGAVRPVAKAEVAARIPPKTARWLDAYFLCAGCGQLYWEGTHVAALRARLAGVLAAAGDGH
ncbi:MAG: Mut7-C RNAse domain-containing protein [Candidatus Krumholzibacteriia bacterium]